MTFAIRSRRNQPAGAPPVSHLVSDTFTRANGAIGNAETGQTWTALGGTWVVASNRATKTDVGNAHHQCYVEMSKTDQDIAANLYGTGGGTIGLVARLVDTNNHYLFQCLIGTVSSGVLYKKVGGAYTLLGTATGVTPGSGDLWRLVVAGTTLTVYRSGVAVIGPVTDSVLTTGTKAGMNLFTGSSSIQVDNFIAD